MSETTKSTSTRGRKPKVQAEEIKDNTIDVTDVVAEMQKQIQALQKQLEASNKKVENSNKEKTDLQELVDALRSNNNSTEQKNLPNKVKVINLLTNKYNLTTQENGQGKAFVFNGFGDMVTMKTSELEEILSVQKQREQAENGYFYILDKDIVADQDLTDDYEKISNKETLEKVMNLETDECVDIFCGLGKEMRESLASTMAEKINNGQKLDRNRLSDIAMRVDIDIEKIAENFKKSKKQ